MTRLRPRVILLIIDQLAGHWADGVVVQSTGLPPPNVRSYHERGLVPRLSWCIENGIWTLAPMCAGKCMTPYGMRYLASGRYDSIGPYFEDNQWRCRPVDGTSYGTLCEWIDEHAPELKMATFASEVWVTPGYWFTEQHCVPLGSYFPDEKALTDYVFPYVKSTPDWDFMVIYLAEHDLTAKIGGLPVFVEKPETHVADKHHHLVDHVDRCVGMLVDFLVEEGAWDETVMVITSDHAYHLGCDALSSSFRPNDGPRTTTDLCWDHLPPWDCYVWDFERNRRTNRWSDCTRRITQIVTGGALPRALRGTTRPHGDLLDATATVAAVLGVPYRTDGTAIVEL